MLVYIFLAVSILGTIYAIWRIQKLMTITESLQNVVAFNKSAVENAIAIIQLIPDRITEVVNKAISEGGSVSDAAVMAAIQEITDDAKRMFAAGDAIPVYFDSQLSTGNPNPTVD